MAKDLGGVFVAGPFSLARDESGSVKTEIRLRLVTILDYLRANGVEVFSAHEREAWGAAIDTPESLVAIDLSALRRSSCLIAYLGSVPSLGTAIEIGVAIGLKKKVLILREPEADLRSDFFQGLAGVGYLIDHTWTSDREVEKAIFDLVRSCEGLKEG